MTRERNSINETDETVSVVNSSSIISGKFGGNMKSFIFPVITNVLYDIFNSRQFSHIKPCLISQFHFQSNEFVHVSLIVVIIESRYRINEICLNSTIKLMHLRSWKRRKRYLRRKIVAVKFRMVMHFLYYFYSALIRFDYVPWLLELNFLKFYVIAPTRVEEEIKAAKKWKHFTQHSVLGFETLFLHK